MNSKPARNRIVYLILIIATILIGLISRTSITPDFIYPYIGDFLYALMIFFIVGFIFNKGRSLQNAFISLLICYLIEISQLYQADWINAIRSYRLGALILGHGFLWSDLISYALACLTGYALERSFQRFRVSKG